ncbi:MAG: hypothetical protein HC915_01135 [Anaerolineae bacterium]|nr:hypothetical protein [Anaerolineae bacterium]
MDVLGVELFREMVAVYPLPDQRPDLAPIHVSGYVTLPGQTRATRSQIILFLNGRHIQDQRLAYAVVQAYHTLIPQGRYPVAVLLIEIAPGEVDVNVHPTKAEVRFRAPDAVFSAVQRAVRKAVLDAIPSYPIHPGHYRSDLSWAGNPAPSIGRADRNPQEAWIAPAQQSPLPIDIPDRGRRTQQIPPPLPGEVDFAHIPEGNSKPAQPRTLPMMRVVGQVAATYIVAEGPAGLYLIDQHAAHERILYEEFMARQKDQAPMLQHALEAAVIQFSAYTTHLVENHLSALNRVGFSLEPFGPQTFRILTVPAVLADYEPAEVLQRVLDDLEAGEPPGARTLEEKLIRRVCKTAAVKAGQVLSYDEMQSLIRQLERCENPHTCPHGRPTMLHMSAADLEREFGRR